MREYVINFRRQIDNKNQESSNIALLGVACVYPKEKRVEVGSAISVNKLTNKELHSILRIMRNGVNGKVGATVTVLPFEHTPSAQQKQYLLDQMRAATIHSWKREAEKLLHELKQYIPTSKPFYVLFIQNQYILDLDTVADGVNIPEIFIHFLLPTSTEKITPSIKEIVCESFISLGTMIYPWIEEDKECMDRVFVKKGAQREWNYPLLEYGLETFSPLGKRTERELMNTWLARLYAKPKLLPISLPLFIQRENKLVSAEDNLDVYDWLERIGVSPNTKLFQEAVDSYIELFGHSRFAIRANIFLKMESKFKQK